MKMHRVRRCVLVACPAAGGRPADLAAGAPSATEREGEERERPEPAGRPCSAWRGALARASGAACVRVAWRTLHASARSARLRTRRTPCALTRRALRAFTRRTSCASDLTHSVCSTDIFFVSDILSPVGLCCAQSQERRLVEDRHRPGARGAHLRRRRHPFIFE